MHAKCGHLLCHKRAQMLVHRGSGRYGLCAPTGAKAPKERLSGEREPTTGSHIATLARPSPRPRSVAPRSPRAGTTTSGSALGPAPGPTPGPAPGPAPGPTHGPYSPRHPEVLAPTLEDTPRPPRPKDHPRSLWTTLDHPGPLWTTLGHPGPPWPKPRAPEMRDAPCAIGETCGGVRGGALSAHIARKPPSTGSSMPVM
jgi:hypothetical protein